MDQCKVASFMLVLCLFQIFTCLPHIVFGAAPPPPPPKDETPPPPALPENDPMYFGSKEYWDKMHADWINGKLTPEEEKVLKEHYQTEFSVKYFLEGDPRDNMNIEHASDGSLRIHYQPDPYYDEWGEDEEGLNIGPEGTTITR